MGKLALALLYGVVITAVSFKAYEHGAHYFGLYGSTVPVTAALLNGVLAGFALLYPKIFASVWGALALLTFALWFFREPVVRFTGMAVDIRTHSVLILSFVPLALPALAGIFAGMRSHKSETPH